MLIKKDRDGTSTNTILKHPYFKKLEKIAFNDFSLAAMSHKKVAFGNTELLPPIVKYGLTYLFVQKTGLFLPLIFYFKYPY